jgi:hypothetical protein
MKNTHRHPRFPRRLKSLAALSLLILAAAAAVAADSLLIKEQGSVFVGGRTIFTDALTGSATGFLPSTRCMSNIKSPRAPIRTFPLSWSTAAA